MQEAQEDVFLIALERNKNSIYRICRVYATIPLEPEDLFQEVVYNIWKSMPAFRHASNIDTWIYRITLNVCLRSKMKLEKGAGRSRRFDCIKFDPVAEPDSNLEEKSRNLYACIAKLPDTEKSIILMFLEDLPYREIASITGLTENHVAVKMKRIRKKLFDCLTFKSYGNI